jgi:hypothetical protein
MAYVTPASRGARLHSALGCIPNTLCRVAPPVRLEYERTAVPIEYQ